MNKYELALVLSVKLEEDARNSALEGVKALLEKSGAVIDNIDDQGKKKFAYEIQKMNEGFYYFITFTAAGDVPAKIESSLRINESVIRFLVVAQGE